MFEDWDKGLGVELDQSKGLNTYFINLLLEAFKEIIKKDCRERGIQDGRKDNTIYSRQRDEGSD